ncbi:MAG: RluA family pseudouridine synthase [Bacteroidota bacterium]
MAKPSIVYEDNHLLIVKKPSGLLVQGDNTGDDTLTDWATEYIRKKYQKPGNVFCHPCHRLDRPVSGLVIFARTSKSLERMNRMFRENEVEKTYLAVVNSSPPHSQGHLAHWLEKDAAKNLTRAYQKQKGKAKLAELSYELISSMGKTSLLKVHPKTGRPHQIRVQLKSIGCSIKGDLKYGYSKPNQDKSIDLHAYKLSFVHPVKKEPITVRSQPDWSDYNAFIDELD